ncbi:VOC family protein [Sphingomonas immobilis]|uniref:VOC family protein n=1 Tax=Sphingomonas immobilis TaxID=3063997 RepID=A0ABT8ZVW6_9SPHN|nr:VOC family protein [Sphingomonas sp. CA1-15]MDO7841711.1 VOC family protein [Sphingomonas sp. CA1-15]
MSAVEAAEQAATRPTNYFYQGDWPGGDYTFFQTAWIVDDLFAAMRRWTTVYGVGPFLVLPKRSQLVDYRGEEIELEIQLAVSQSGPVQLELIQQFSDRPSVYREIFGDRPGGFHHVCTISKAFEETKAHYESLGYPSIARIKGPMKVEYFDTFKDFGHITELAEYSPEFFGAHVRNAEICKTWDGTDPIRMLTRGGYRLPES